MTQYLSPQSVFSAQCQNPQNLLVPKPKQIGHYEPDLTVLTAGDFVVLDFGAYGHKGFRHSYCHGWSAGVITFIQENC